MLQNLAKLKLLNNGNLNHLTEEEPAVSCPCKQYPCPCTPWDAYSTLGDYNTRIAPFDYGPYNS